MKNHLLRAMRTWPACIVRPCTTAAYKPIKRPAPDETLPPLRTPSATASDPKALPSLVDRLKLRIQAAGPISVAKYMKEVLTNWSGGYYMAKDVFGHQGDFITSPEIGQIFGELVAVWLYTEWTKCGSPKPLQIVELGPGRGTMIQDVLRVLSKLGAGKGLSVHLVEVSPFMSQAQAQRLCLKTSDVRPDGDKIRHYKEGETVSGIPVYWYDKIQDVPSEFTVVLAHEFFDALPINKFVKQDEKWREVLVDVGEGGDGFRFVASKNETPMLKLFLQQLRRDDQRQHIEHSFETQQIVEHLVERFERHGGFGLIMDYGHTGDGQDTFRAFKQHKQQDPLLAPGSADLTADVDFRHLQRVAESENRLITFGPVEQGVFLKKLNGDERLAQLLAHAQTPEAKESLQTGYDMLTNPTQMGSRFKFFSMFPAVLKEHLAKYPVNGFH